MLITIYEQNERETSENIQYKSNLFNCLSAFNANNNVNILMMRNNLCVCNIDYVDY